MSSTDPTRGVTGRSHSGSDATPISVRRFIRRLPRSPRRLQEQIRDLARLEQDRSRALERISARTSALHRLTSALSAALSLEDVARVVAQHAAPALDAAFSNIAIVSDSGSRLRLLHHASLDQEIAQRWERIGIDAPTPLSAAVRGREPVLVPDPAAIRDQFPIGAADAERAGFQALAALPVIDQRGRVVAAVGAAWSTPQPFDTTQVAEMRNVAELCGQAISRGVEHRREVRARKWAEGYQAVLERLGRALTVEEVTAVAAQAAADTFGAKRAGVHLRDPLDPGALVLASQAGEPGEIPQEWQRVPVSAPIPGAEAVRKGEVVIGASRSDIASRWPKLDLGPATLDTLVALPLEVGGEVVGALWMSFATETVLHPSSRLVLGALASATGHALSRARRYETEHQVAVTLQRSLLTPVVARHPRIEVSARYLPGTEGIEVGGDFYDVIPGRSDELVLVVGDVVGHGIQAAAAMGQLRSATRALVGFCEGPADLLEHLDAFVLTTPELYFATLVCAAISGDATRIDYASAGHPPIALRAPNGTVDLLDAGRSAPLGVVPKHGRRPQASAALEPGTTVLLYTDGLVERRDEVIDVGLARLGQTLAGATRPGATEVCDAAVDALVDPQQQEDDVALLAAHVLAVPRLTLRMEPRFDRLGATRHALQDWMGEHGVDPDDRQDVMLAAGEALANAVEHGAARVRRPVDLDARIELVRPGGAPGAPGDEVLVIVVQDPGQWRAPNRERDPRRGRGLDIMRRLCEVRVTAGATTTVELRRVLHPRVRVPGPAALGETRI